MSSEQPEKKEADNKAEGTSGGGRKRAGKMCYQCGQVGFRLFFSVLSIKFAVQFSNEMHACGDYYFRQLGPHHRLRHCYVIKDGTYCQGLSESTP